MVELYGAQLAGSPVFTRRLVEAPGELPSDLVFVEEPSGTRLDLIRAKVEEGFMVITFADKNTAEARNSAPPLPRRRFAPARTLHDPVALLPGRGSDQHIADPDLSSHDAYNCNTCSNCISASPLPRGNTPSACETDDSQDRCPAACGAAPAAVRLTECSCWLRLGVRTCLAMVPMITTEHTAVQRRTLGSLSACERKCLHAVNDQAAAIAALYCPSRCAPSGVPLQVCLFRFAPSVTWAAVVQTTPQYSREYAQRARS